MAMPQGPWSPPQYAPAQPPPPPPTKRRSWGLVLLAVFGGFFVFAVTVRACARALRRPSEQAGADVHAPEPATSSSAAAASNSAAAVPSEPPKSWPGQMMEAKTIPEALDLAKRLCKEGDVEVSCRALLFAGNSDHAQLEAYLKKQPDHTYAEVAREGEDAYGWRFCSSGRLGKLIKLKPAESRYKAIYASSILRGDGRTVQIVMSFVADEGTSVSMCGLVVGTTDDQTPVVVPGYFIQ